MRTRSFAPPHFGTHDFTAPAFSRAQWFEFFYRVRRWSFTATAEADETEGEFLNLFSSGGTIGPENEQQIFLFELTNASFEQDGINIDFAWSGYPVLRSNRTLWVPRCDVTVTHADITVTTRTDTSANLPSGYTGMVMGADLSQFYYEGSDISGSVEIEPVAWWPRRRSDNTRPITDADTGARLLNPLQLDELP